MNHIEFNYHLKNLNKSNDSLEVIYNYYYSRIVIYIKHNYEGGNFIAQDVAQEFFQYLLRLKDKPYINNPSAWIYKCCDHIALKLLKTERKYSTISEEVLATESNLEDSVYGDLDIYIKQLDETTQEIIRLIYVEKRNALEVSKILKIKYANVRQKHARGIKKIKNLCKGVTKS